jgi:hypothetical protein
MLIGTKSKFVVVLLSVAFLLFNPAGFCTNDMTAQSGGHPCCPKAPASVKASCLCIDRQPASPTVPAPMESGVVVAVSTVTPLPVIEVGDASGETSAFSPLDRSIAFHQLLV